MLFCCQRKPRKLP
ncbi:hypothetical protein QR98_0039300, partial [Sarcoptes scabiei]